MAILEETLRSVRDIFSGTSVPEPETREEGDRRPLPATLYRGISRPLPATLYRGISRPLPGQRPEQRSEQR